MEVRAPRKGLYILETEEILKMRSHHQSIRMELEHLNLLVYIKLDSESVTCKEGISTLTTSRIGSLVVFSYLLHFILHTYILHH